MLNCATKLEFLECQYWENEQFFRSECLEISGVSESVTDKDQGKSLPCLKIDVEV